MVDSSAHILVWKWWTLVSLQCRHRFMCTIDYPKSPIYVPLTTIVRESIDITINNLLVCSDDKTNVPLHSLSDGLFFWKPEFLHWHSYVPTTLTHIVVSTSHNCHDVSHSFTSDKIRSILKFTYFISLKNLNSLWYSDARFIANAFARVNDSILACVELANIIKSYRIKYRGLKQQSYHHTDTCRPIFALFVSFITSTLKSWCQILTLWVISAICYTVTLIDIDTVAYSETEIIAIHCDFRAWILELSSSVFFHNCSIITTESSSMFLPHSLAQMHAD